MQVVGGGKIVPIQQQPIQQQPIQQQQVNNVQGKQNKTLSNLEQKLLNKPITDEFSNDKDIFTMTDKKITEMKNVGKYMDQKQEYMEKYNKYMEKKKNLEMKTSELNALSIENAEPDSKQIQRLRKQQKAIVTGKQIGRAHV